MGQAAGRGVPEGLDPDAPQDKCQGLTLNKKVFQKNIFSLSFYSHGGIFCFFVDNRLSHGLPITKNSHVTVTCLFVCPVLFQLVYVSSRKPVGLCPDPRRVIFQLRPPEFRLPNLNSIDNICYFLFFPFSITSFTLNLVIFEINSYGIGFPMGNLTVPFDVS